jgi:hypothetical protein
LRFSLAALCAHPSSRTQVDSVLQGKPKRVSANPAFERVFNKGAVASYIRQVIAMTGFWKSRSQRFLAWWSSPLKLWQRVLICAATFFYFGIIGAVSALLFGVVPIFPLQDLLFSLATWSLPAALLGCFLAYRFPRAMLCIIFPLSMIGIGDVQIS